MPTLLESFSCCYGRVDRCDGAEDSREGFLLLPADKDFLGRPSAAVSGLPRTPLLEDPGMVETVRLAEALLPGGQMTHEQCEWCTVHNVRRYFQGRGGNPAAAAAILAQALSWRQEYRAVLSGEREPVWQTDLRVLARGDDGAPKIYGCFRHNVPATAANTQHIFDHMAAVLETASRSHRHGATNADNIMDCHGFRMADNLNPAPMFQLMKMANQPYRDGLRTAILVDAPSSFYMLWRAAQPFLSEKTKSKIRFVSHDEAVALIASTSGAKAAAMVQRIMAENRSAEGCTSHRLPSEVRDDDDTPSSASEPQRSLTRTLSRKLSRALSGMHAVYQHSTVTSRFCCCRRRRPDDMDVQQYKFDKFHVN
mmetsp:Transcript_140426/g.448814  ORF Transcript_140426/g.448814 Transcript_140426/m.448814 type:complete len:367 (+) Transcript_140426:74-1174(+)